mmetsp:Transcript_90504/g.251572  ORF Transcript_90504/g.251572 Transcript_90504/m.251572 type:complete len:494 (+) Transcript_90504:108-1589(+)
MQSVTATRPWASLLSAPAVPHPAPTHELTGVPLTTDRWDAPGQPLSGCQAANSLWVLLGSLSLLPPLVAVGKGRHLLQGRRLQRIAMHARVLRAMSRRGMAVVERGEVPAVPYVRTQWAQGGAATAASDAYEPSPAMGSAPQASPQATIGVMPPELAAITHATLFGRGGEVQLPAHALRRELGSGIFSALRADARGARAMLSAGASGLACKATLDVEVRAFLARSWWRLAAALTPEAGLRRLRRAASLLGLLLAAVPEAEAREGFGRVLAEWSAPQGAGLQRRVSRVRSCTELRAMLEDHTVALAFAEELSPEARHAHARNVLHILRTMPQDAELAVQAVTEAAAIVAEAMPEFLDESVEVIKRPALRTIKNPKLVRRLAKNAELQELLEVLEPRTEGRVVVHYRCVQRGNVLVEFPTDDLLTNEGEKPYELQLPDGWEYHGDLGPWQQRSGVFVGPSETLFEAKRAIADLYVRYVSYGCVSMFEAKVDVRPI